MYNRVDATMLFPPSERKRIEWAEAAYVVFRSDMLVALGLS